MDYLRVVLISDTHCHENEIPLIPDGDIIIHAGDFTRFGLKTEIVKFKTWFAALPHCHKVFIAGNHELSLDKEHFVRLGHTMIPTNSTKLAQFPDKYANSCREEVLAHGSVYLEDSTYTVRSSDGRNVISMYGSPYQPECCNYAFNLPRGDPLRQEWSKIPSDTDILITHGPPKGICDKLEACTELCPDGHAGCEELLKDVKERIKPRLHVFGHLHHGYGKYV
jgi:hypothetical protein